MTSKPRSYTEMCSLETFEERFDYLSLGGVTGVATFGFDRYLNQMFYASREWKNVREWVIVRDEGCDLAVPGHEIYALVLVHHINPITPQELSEGAEIALDPDNLVTTTTLTHNAIHYGDKTSLPEPFTERSPNDTKLW